MGKKIVFWEEVNKLKSIKVVFLFNLLLPRMTRSTHLSEITKTNFYLIKKRIEVVENHLY